MNGVAFCLVGIPPCPETAASVHRDGLGSANENPRPVLEGRTELRWAGPRNLLLRKMAEPKGFGFTLRHFIVYPPESALRDEINGNERGRLEPMDTIFVKNVRENGPAHVAGLCPGDRLVKVNGESVLGKTYAQVISLIQNSECVLELSIMPKDEDVLQLAYSQDAYLRENVSYVGGAQCIPAPPPPCYHPHSPSHGYAPSGQKQQDWWGYCPSPASPLDNWMDRAVARCSSSSSGGHTHHLHSDQMCSASPSRSSATAQALSDWYYSQTHTHTHTPPPPHRRPPRRRSASQDRLGEGCSGRGYSSQDALQQQGHAHCSSDRWGQQGVWPVRSRSESVLLARPAHFLEPLALPLDRWDWQAPPWAESSNERQNHAMPSHIGTTPQLQQVPQQYGHTPQHTPQHHGHTPQHYGHTPQHTPQHYGHTPQHTPQHYGHTPQHTPQHYGHTLQLGQTSKQLPQHTTQRPSPQLTPEQRQKSETHTLQQTPAHTLATHTPVPSPQHTHEQTKHTHLSHTQQTSNHTSPAQTPAPQVCRPAPQVRRLSEGQTEGEEPQGYRSYSPSFYRKTGRILQQAHSFRHGPQPDTLAWSPPTPPSPKAVFSDTPPEGQPTNQVATADREAEPEVVMRQKPPGGRKVPHALHLPPDYALDCLNLSDHALSLGSATEHAPPAFPAPIYSADQSANAGPSHDNQPAAIGSAPRQQSAGSLPVQEDCLATIPFIDEPTSPSVDLRARLVSASSVVSSGSADPAPITGPAHMGQRSPADHALSRVDHAPSPSFSSLLSHKLHLSHYTVKSSRRSSYLLAVMTTRSKSCDEGLNMFREEQHALGRRPKRAKSFLTDEVLGSKRHSASELDSSSYSVSWREGWLHYKQLQTGGSKKVASGIRPWRRAYAVLRSHLLFLYKDKREAVLGGGAEDEQPINIAGCLVDIAYSETRRKNVLRLSTQDYSEHLLQATDTDDMLTWVLSIRDNSRSGSEELSFSKQALINKKLNDYRKQCVAGNRPDSSPRLSRMKPPFLLPKSDSPVPPRSPKPDTKDESPPKSPWGISLMKRGRRAGAGTGAGPKAFGVRLDECQPATNNKYVPLLVEVCCGLVEGAGGLVSIGIYRVPGNNAAVCSLQEALNRGADINTADEKWQDLNVVSSLLKSFFRKLPEPLFTDEKYSEFIEANRMEVASGRLRTLKKLIHGLPDHHFYTLKFLLGHLKTVAEHADKNKMEARNLALVFGPTLVRMSEDNMMDMVTHMPDRYKIVETLLQHYEWFFSQEVGKEEKTPVDPEDIQPAPNIDHLLSNIGRTGTMGEPLDLNTNESAKSKGACPDVLMLSIMSAVTKRRRQRHQAPPLSNKESELQPITASITVDSAPKAEGEEDDDDGDDDGDDGDCDDDDGDCDGDGNDGDDDGDGDDLVEDGSARVPSEMLPVVTKGQQSEGGVAQSFMVSEYSTPSTIDPTPSTIGPTSPSTGPTLSNMDPAPSIIGSTPSIIGSTPSTLGRSVCEEADDEYSELDTESSSTSPPAHTHTPTHTPTHTQTHTPNITHAATTSTSCLRAGPSHSRLQSRPSFSSHRLMQCDTLARKRQKGGLRTRPPELLELPLDSFGQGAGPTSNPSSPAQGSPHTPPHTPTHTAPHTHTLPEDRSHTHSLNRPHTHTHSLDTPHSHTHSLDTPHSPHSHTHTHSLDSPPESLAPHTHTHSHTLPVDTPHSHTLTVDTPHSHTLTVDTPHSHTLTVDTPHSHTHSLKVDTPQSHTHSHTLTVDTPHSHTLTVDTPHSHTHTHSLTVDTPHSHTLTVDTPHSHTHSEAAAFSPRRPGGQAGGRGLVGSAEELWPIGVGEGEGLLRARLSPETRRRRRAWRRHTVVASPTEPPVAPGNKPSLATPTARPTDVTTATSPPQTSRFHQFL